ncbi:hypothetical protein LFJ66_000132 [Clostridium perfringens]|nr:hypothetical protein [Clostridium perfringens]
MKKLISVFMLVMLGMTLFIGCGSSSVISKVETKQVMNGTGDKEIGKYGEAEYNPEKLTDKDLLKFYDENIKDSGLSWFILIDKNDKTKGIMFPGCNVVLEYGTIGKEGNIANVERSRIIDGNLIKDMK